MSKLLSLDAKISVECKAFEMVRKAHTWFTNKNVLRFAVIILFVIDVMGFKQIADATMKVSPINRTLIVSAFAVAFEAAPLYIGYAICLKCYKLGQSIHNVILGLSMTAFILGIIGNGVYRFMTMNTAYSKPSLDSTLSELPETALPMTIIMFILPLLTSLINIVVGCLSFDPLLFDLLRLSKKIKKLRIMKRRYETYLEEMNNDSSMESDCIESENSFYESAKISLYATRSRLISYIKACVSSSNRIQQ